MQHCSLQHQTLLPLPVTFTHKHINRCYCCFGSVSSFSLELFIHYSPVAYWAPTDLGSSSFSVPSFCLFILFMGFSRQEYWNGFLSPVDHILSELSTMTCLSWVALHGVAHGFIELDKAVGWMASLTQWTWVWVNSGSWWWTGRPGVLRFMGSQRVGHDWATELNCGACDQFD